MTVPDAVVNPGVMTAGLSKSLIEELGLRKARTRRIHLAGGPVDADEFSAVRLTVQGRDCVIDVMELPDGVPALIGQVPLELLDFVVDPARRELTGNPRHDGEWVYEAYAATGT